MINSNGASERCVWRSEGLNRRLLVLQRFYVLLSADAHSP